MSRSRWVVLAVVLAAIVGVVVWSGAFAPAGAPAGEANAPASVSFRLKWLVYSSFGTHFVALEKGLFAEERLNVTLQPGGPGIDPIRLVATGADDVGLASYDQILIAREKGIPLVAIGEDTIRSGVAMLALEKSGIVKPEDMIGHKIGIMPGTDKFTVYCALMAARGIDRSKVVEVPVAFDLAVLFSGVIDVFPGFLTNQPFLAAEKGMPVTVIDPWDYGVRPGGNVFFTSEQTLKAKRGVLKRFLRAELRGLLASLKLDDGEVVDLVMKHNDKLDRAAEIKIWGATKDLLLEKDPARVGIMSAERWQQTLDISVKYGLVAKAPDLAPCYTNALIEEIHREGLSR